MTMADIAAQTVEREARYAALIKDYDLRPVRQAPFVTCTARDLAVRLDKIQRGIVG